MIYVHRKVAFATMILNVRFLPGMNSISDGEMELINKDKRAREIFDEEIECGNMVIGGTVQSETSDAADPDLDMKQRAEKMAKEIKSVTPVSAAKKLITQCNDAHVLHAVLKIDGRVGVQDSAERRLASIKGQEGSDLKPESKVAPEGDGSDFDEKIGSGTAAKTGHKGHTAIPALKGKTRDEVM